MEKKQVLNITSLFLCSCLSYLACRLHLFLRCSILSPAVCLGVPYFFILSHKRHDFRGKYIIQHHHHVKEGLGLIPVPCILKMKLVPPSLPRSSYVSSSFWFIIQHKILFFSINFLLTFWHPNFTFKF